MDLSHIQLVAIDLDGTLLDENKRCNTYTQKTIQRLIQTGKKVCFITGRSFNDSIDIAQQCKLVDTLVTVNGAHIWDFKTQQTIYVKAFDLYTAHDIILYARQSQEFLWLYTDTGVFYETSNDLLRSFQKKYPVFKSTQCNFDDLDSTQLLKVLFLLRKNKALVIQQYFKDSYKDTINPIFTNPNIQDPLNPHESLTYLEILNAKNNKGTALMFLSKYYNIPLQNIIAFGDEDNDIEMLQHAGYAVTMEQAKSHIKKIADYTTLSNADSGLAVFIEKFML